jgi:MULE transposase domain
MASLIGLYGVNYEISIGSRSTVQAQNISVEAPHLQVPITSFTSTRNAVSDSTISANSGIPGTEPSDPISESEEQSDSNELVQTAATSLDERPLLSLTFKEMLLKGSAETKFPTTKHEYSTYIVPFASVAMNYVAEGPTFRAEYSSPSSSSRKWQLKNVLKDYRYLPSYLQSLSSFDYQDSSWDSKQKFFYEGTLTTANVNNIIFKCNYCTEPNIKCKCIGEDYFRVYETGFVFHYTAVNDIGESCHSCIKQTNREPFAKGTPSWMHLIIDDVTSLGYTPEITLSKVKDKLGLNYFKDAKIKHRINTARNNVTVLPATVGELVKRFNENTFNPNFKPTPGVDDDVLLGSFVSTGNEGTLWTFTTPAMLRSLNKVASIHIDATYNADEKNTELLYLQGVDSIGKVFPVAVGLCDAESEACYRKFFKDSLFNDIGKRLPASDRPKIVEREDGTTYFKFEKLKFVVCDGIGYMSRLVEEIFGPDVVRVMCYFHVKQALRKWIKSMCRGNQDFCIRMVKLINGILDELSRTTDPEQFLFLWQKKRELISEIPYRNTPTSPGWSRCDEFAKYVEKFIIVEDRSIWHHAFLLSSQEDYKNIRDFNRSNSCGESGNRRLKEIIGENLPVNQDLLCIRLKEIVFPKLSKIKPDFSSSDKLTKAALV